MTDGIVIFHFRLFLTFCLPNSPKKDNKMKKQKQQQQQPGDIIILHKCTKNHDHMLYCLPEIYGV